MRYQGGSRGTRVAPGEVPGWIQGAPGWHQVVYQGGSRGTRVAPSGVPGWIQVLLIQEVLRWTLRYLVGSREIRDKFKDTKGVSAGSFGRHLCFACPDACRCRALGLDRPVPPRLPRPLRAQGAAEGRRPRAEGACVGAHRVCVQDVCVLTGVRVCVCAKDRSAFVCVFVCECMCVC